MDENQNLVAGLSKGQLVLYVGIALAVIVFFSALVASQRESVSDTPPVATGTIEVVPSATAPQTSTATSSDTSTPKPEPFTFEVVSTPGLRSQGLSGRKELAANYGMLFAFPEKERYGFWMKDMRLPIDIIWLADTDDGTATIVGIEENISPNTYPDVFTAPEPVRYVLETRAGETRRLGWSVGTRLTLPSGIPVPQ